MTFKQNLNSSKIYLTLVLLLLAVILVVVVQSSLANRQREKLVQQIHNEVSLYRDNPQKINSILLSYENDLKNLSRPLLNLKSRQTHAFSGVSDPFSYVKMGLTTCDYLIDVYMATYESEVWPFDERDAVDVRNWVTNMLSASDCAF